MAINYVVGNLLEASREDIIIHGVNARGAFGSGVAGAMARVWPAARDSYLKAYRAGVVVPGRVIWAIVGDRIVGHAVTQPTYGSAGIHVSMPAVRSCMAEVATAASQGLAGIAPRGFSRVAMPRIGAGLGGGNWREIENVIDETCSDLDVSIYVLSLAEVPTWRKESHRPSP